jgi:outer membrane protein TolC
MWICFAVVGASADEGSEPLDRAAFVAAVLEANPELASVRHDAEAAVARAGSAGRWTEPVLGLSVAPLSLSSRDVRAGYEVSLAQVLPLSGQPRAERDLSRAESGVSEALLDARRLELAVEASALFADWRFVHEARSLLDEQNRVLDEVSRSVRAAFTATDAGLGAVLGVEQDRIEIEERSLDLEAARIGVLAAMNALLHRDMLAPLGPPEPSDPRSTTEDDADPAAEPPDLIRARREAEATSFALSAVRRSNVPEPMLMASYETMWDHVEHRLMVGVELPLPVQPGRRRALVDEGKEKLAASESRSDAAEDNAGSRLAAARARWDAAVGRLALHEGRAIPVAEQRLDAERAAFEAGRGELIGLLDAARRLLDARWSAAAARADTERTWAELQGAAGRLEPLAETP